MKKLAAWLLALVMALSLTACGSKEQTKELVGTWHCHIDMAEQVDALLGDAMGAEDFSTGGEVPVCLDFIVSEDNTYTLALDYDETEAAMKDYFAALTSAMVEVLYAQAEAEGMSREQYDAALKQLGFTAEEFIASALDAFTVERIADDILGSDDAVVSSGVCRAMEGKLYLVDTAEELETVGYLAYTLENDTLTWVDEDGVFTSLLSAEAQEYMSYPMVWTR